MTTPTKTVIIRGGQHFIVIQERGFSFYLYTTDPDEYDSHDDLTEYRTLKQAIRRAEELAQARNDAKRTALRAEVVAILAGTA